MPKQLIHRRTSSSTNNLARDPPTALLGQPAHNLRHIIRRPHPMLHRRHLFRLVDKGVGYTLQHVRLDRPGLDTVDRRAIAAQLDGKNPRQGLNRRLAGAVDGQTGKGGARGQGRDVDDAARTSQVRQHGLRHEERAAHVEVVDGGEVGGGDGAERLDLLDAGVVDEDVDCGAGRRGEGGDGGGDDGLWGFDEAEVGAHGGGAGAVVEVLDLGDEVLDAGFAGGRRVGYEHLGGMNSVCALNGKLLRLTLLPRLASS